MDEYNHMSSGDGDSPDGHGDFELDDINVGESASQHRTGWHSCRARNSALTATSQGTLVRTAHDLLCAQSRDKARNTTSTCTSRVHKTTRPLREMPPTMANPQQVQLPAHLKHNLQVIPRSSVVPLGSALERSHCLLSLSRLDVRENITL